MNGINPADMKMLSSIIIWAIHFDTVTHNMLMLHFNCKEDFARAAIVALHSLGVLNKENPSDDKEPWNVMYSELTDIPNDMLNILQMNGFTISQIGESLKGLPRDKKHVSSNILTDKAHKWVPVDLNHVEKDKKYIIRIFDESRICMETRTEIVYLEDIKIGSFDGSNWNVEGPFPLFDFSPCSKHRKINEGCVVTHIAEATEKELDQWKHRFDPLHKYEKFEISVDDSMLEAVYRSLVLAASCISKEAINYPEGHDVRKKMEESYRIICDMQSVLDRGGSINALD